MTVSNTSGPQTPCVNVSRFIRAPRQRVFDAWTTHLNAIAGFLEQE
ncbi:MAG: hypothetical protein ACE5GE_01640 [Phycisphaerae bacterium]